LNDLDGGKEATMMRFTSMFAAAALSLWVSDAAAHGVEKHPGSASKAISTEQHPWGRQGDPRKATRTIDIDMADTLRFTPAQLTVKRGDTVTFVVRNTGKTLHEMVIGTQAELREHAELMKKFPDMEHDAPFMAHVAPGKTEKITWTFDKPGTFMYGCLVPGHWEAGMKGTIVVAN
jgi:uncharacterized cupredoxin-like copper-binding protein